MAKGSHAGWSPGDDRICFVCGRKIVLSRQSAQIHYDAVKKEHWSVHAECGPPVKRP
jgi:hypothetical protein